jgi:hypothetical protein
VDDDERRTAGAQAQVDWAEYPGMVLGGEIVDLSAASGIGSVASTSGATAPRRRNATPCFYA